MKTFNSSIRFLQRVLLVTLLAITQGSCENRPDAVALSLVSYNYTGRYISAYYVEGQGGGGSTENGSGPHCCLSFRPDSKTPFTVRVDWTLEDIRDFKNDKWVHGEPETHAAIVEVKGPIPTNPGYFGTHFMADGTVKAYITELPPDPYFTPDGKPIQPMP